MGIFDRLFRDAEERDAAKPAVPAFGYAVVGLGHIAEYFLKALEQSPVCRVAAVVSGDVEKAQRLRKRFQVPRALTYDAFDSLRDDPAVQAVYLALPVSMHREFTERAAAAGKHVLCEKPMASTAEDASAMVEACRSAGVRLSVAYRCPHTFVHREARRLLQTGALGPRDTLQIESGFGFPLKPGWRTEPGFAGGGSLYDVGIYPLNAARFLLGEEPTGVRQAAATCAPNGLEEEIEWVNQFPSGAVLSGRSSYRTLIRDTLKIGGSRGSLLLSPAFSHRETLKMAGEYRDEQGAVIPVDVSTPADEVSQFRMEAEQLAHSVLHGEPMLTPGEDGLSDMVAMEAIYRAAGVRTGVGMERERAI